MTLTLRHGTIADTQACGQINYEAFKTVAEEHGFPPDFPSAEVATGFCSNLLSNPSIHGVVAELDGTIVGSNFLDERSTIAGIGPISVSPAVQNGTIGRQLMQAVLDRASEKGFIGVRLVQSAYHNRSLGLYTKLGFRAREPLSVMQGAAIGSAAPGAVRAATMADAPDCNRLCERIHGHARAGELEDAIRHDTARVVERLGHISGYTTQVAFFGHSVAETTDDLKALIMAAPDFQGPGFLVPTRNYELFRWCLDQGLRLVMQTTLMTIGVYNEPVGAYLPSILY
jgi:predicted N-acetyltransferase YhbS